MTATIRFESRLRRPPKGTQIELGGTLIQFTADASGREIADVPADLAHYLDAIPEGYARVDGSARPPRVQPLPAESAASPTPPAPPPHMDAPGTEKVDEGDGHQDDISREAARPADTGGAAGGKPADLTDMDDDALRAVFEREVGRKPSARAGRDTMIAQIEQARSEIGA